ncbi:B12-binding domain-containing radical SAM protein [candidate division KSB1 bacterium]|nr:B12-binding domain-containing radical SAM protein [candidate division KSB1 bacterium]
MKNPFKKANCLIVQSEFSAFSYWNYEDVCKLVGAKYPAAPLGLLTVAALLPQQWTFKLVDANVETVLDQHFEWADIVCVGGMLPQQSSMLSIIKRAQHFNRPVVVGGPDPTSQPEVYQCADYLVLGEGEVTIPMFIADLEAGRTSGLYQSDEKADMTKAVVPRFDLIRFKDYLHVGIQYSRGCPFYCEFCNIVELFGRSPRTKTPGQMLCELKTLYDLGYRGHVDIVDDNFIGNKTKVKKVLTVIKEWSEFYKHPFYFSTECSINLADDEDLMQLMKDLDFRYVFVGIETPETTALIKTNKTTNVNKPVAATIKKINLYGMIVNAGFIIGFDDESDQIAENMIRCVQDSGVAMAMLGMLYALPNTRLSRRLKSEGRLFENSSTFSTDQTPVDQTSTGLNFITKRPRIDILRDYLCVQRFIYNPKSYFSRVIQTALQLKWIPKFRPGFIDRLKTGKAFLNVSRQLGNNRSTVWPYFKMLLTVLFKNPVCLEPAVNLAAMFIHFQKQSKFIIKNITREIEAYES